jgi:hypothetical protein
MVLVFRDRWNPGAQEDGVEDGMNLPGCGKLQLI